MADPHTRSPFPGMDPYLEQSWGDVHHRLCTYCCDMLRRGLPSGLIARLDERTFIETSGEISRTIIPDVRVVERGWGSEGGAVAVMEVAEPLIIDTPELEITEAFVQVIDTRNGSRVVTVIEFMSPTNKITADGRRKYQQKRDELLAGGVNLVEIDLVRLGESIMLATPAMVLPSKRGLYQICVTRGTKPKRHEVYPIRLQERLPTIRIPLRPTDDDITLNLQALIDQVYENGSYGFDIDYSQPPIPALPEQDALWAANLLGKH